MGDEFDFTEFSKKYPALDDRLGVRFVLDTENEEHETEAEFA